MKKMKIIDVFSGILEGIKLTALLFLFPCVFCVMMIFDDDDDDDDYYDDDDYDDLIKCKTQNEIRYSFGERIK